jgi:hypothetical protein
MARDFHQAKVKAGASGNPPIAWSMAPGEIMNVILLCNYTIPSLSLYGYGGGNGITIQILYITQ